ncbi:TAM domain methyltransferase [Histoplasma capsulatum]|uniref:TAM domain methyltransferase n=1 Tax=Ajellomyces capsulatus TaxID=5037 RepID=A0A8A1MIS1_AJECA|nr:TAM domain methyltransferase [Histoplasma capsulatum]
MELDGERVSDRSRVEVDESSAENRATLSEELLDFTESLHSSIVHYEWKNGRRYREGNYKFPNDEREQDRLNLVHYAIYYLCDEKLFMAPFNPDGKRILDTGTGTGKWPIEMGDLYPSAELTGVDLSPIQPRWAPPNVKFIVEDIEEDWIETEQYDFIHCRYLMGSIKDWPRLVKKYYQHLKPGGWVEFKDSTSTIFSEDGSVTPDYKVGEMLRNLRLASERIGITMDHAPSLKGWMEQAGFTNIEQRTMRLPIGTWPKNKRLKLIGAMMASHYLEGVEAFTLIPFTEILGWTTAEVDELNAQVRAAVQTKGVHPLHIYYVVWGQKPET